MLLPPHSLCDVDDFYDDYRLEKISALAKIHNTVSITPNEVYSVHTVGHFLLQLLLSPMTWRIVAGAEQIPGQA